MNYQIFIDSKYTNWYFGIVENAVSCIRIKSNENLYESHHIIPKSLGGNNDKENLVLLTPREHFICHWLLTKMVHIPRHKKSMYHAMHRLTFGNNKHLSWQYEKARIAQRNALLGKCRPKETKEKISKSQTGENNSFYGKSHSTESKKLISQKTKNAITDEWRKQNSDRNKGENNSMYGRSIVKEKNLKWYNNGIDVIYVSEGTQPNGYIRGRKLA